MATVVCIDCEGNRWRINAKDITGYAIKQDKRTGERYGILRIRSIARDLPISDWEEVLIALRRLKLLGEVMISLPEL